MTPAAAVTDFIGFLAAGMTITAFCCTRMLCLRSAAILANVLFIAYGALLGLMPVLGLHCALLPLNLVRFAQCWRDTQADLRRDTQQTIAPRRSHPQHHS
ncbi:hypothetical protein SAMN04515666_1083 [Bosea lupini]|uniref:Inner membrane protein n=1 Tax=Bosea lupini TaxID=1036779 RepID=A0A1H7W3T4_9HYPH|nr:hypothetical protein [Bosea lupini]SEM16203.1 hypothetical protein SAMN04515666_1083 [Bosea lupini]